MKVDEEYCEAKGYFNITASCLVDGLRKQFQMHQDIEMSSAKLAELIMVKLMKERNVTKVTPTPDRRER